MGPKKRKIDLYDVSHASRLVLRLDSSVAPENLSSDIRFPGQGMENNNDKERAALKCVSCQVVKMGEDTRDAARSALNLCQGEYTVPINNQFKACT